ncbi:hypothetical protein [Alicyclobacillus acidoterrestris]|nr:hypothetical protein [Alicyclobacillus acidoterrestris]EPZ40684.1 hypothetical protein N007_17855 [Alicyclobacillus acidoterrestris ATCC 49025]
MDKKIWFITGASRGFGRIWAEAALTRGDRSQLLPALWQTLPI